MPPRSPALLWVTTKTPWPPIDGGRLLVVETLRALHAAGVAITLVAPALAGKAAATAAAGPLGEFCRAVLVPVRSRGRLASLLSAKVLRVPVTLARHRQRRVREAVAREVLAPAPALVVAEQLQALWAARAGGLPIVLRQQNVESDLWTAWAERGGLFARSLSAEAKRLRRAEVEALRGVAATITLTARDCARLRELGAGEVRIESVPAPFPEQLPAAERSLDGSPPIVLLGSGGWAPNRDQVDWFVGEVWPLARAAVPAARLHVFGAPADGADVRVHAAPADSKDAFAPGAVLVVPLRVGSGVRMKILEAWARGVPGVATPAAAEGLEARDGAELLLAKDGAGFAAALSRLGREPGLAGALTAAGRNLLRRRHDPARVAAQLIEIFASVEAAASRS